MTFFTPADIEPHRRFKKGDVILTVSPVIEGRTFWLSNHDSLPVAGTKMEIANYLSENKFEPLNDIKVSVATMKTSDGSDFYVKLECDGRSLTPYVFKERYKAEYTVAEFNWLFHGAPKPDLMDYNMTNWPGKSETRFQKTGEWGQH